MTRMRDKETFYPHSTRTSLKVTAAEDTFEAKSGFHLQLKLLILRELKRQAPACEESFAKISLSVTLQKGLAG